MENANSAARLIRKLLSEICPEDVCKDKICHVTEAGNMHDRCRETARSGGAPLPFEEFYQSFDLGGRLSQRTPQISKRSSIGTLQVS
jgi:hypothetical protein